MEDMVKLEGSCLGGGFEKDLLEVLVDIQALVFLLLCFREQGLDSDKNRYAFSFFNIIIPLFVGPIILHKFCNPVVWRFAI